MLAAVSFPSTKSIGFPSCLKTPARHAARPLWLLPSRLPPAAQSTACSAVQENWLPSARRGDRTSSLHSAIGNFRRANPLLFEGFEV